MKAKSSSLAWLLVGAGALLAGLSFAVDRAAIEPGERPPAHDAPVVANGEGTLTVGGAGQVTVVEFFASWCGSCAQEVPKTERAVEAHGARFVAVSLDESALEAKRAARSWQLRGVVVHDRDRKLREAYHVRSVPTLVVLDERGATTFSRVGGIAETELAERIGQARMGGATSRW